MIMAEEGNVTMMSVELAIRRELDYRKKVASFFPESENDFLPLKVPCPTKASPANVRSKDLLGQSSTSSASHQHPFLNQLHEKSPSSSITGDQPCPIPIASVTRPANQNPLPMHGEDSVSWQWSPLNVGPAYPRIDGTAAGRLRSYSTQQPQSSFLDVNSVFFCKVCKVNCSGQVSYKQHLRGQKHRGKLQLHQMIGAHKKPQQHRCNVCEIWCSDENALQLHLHGQKHKAKLLEIGNGSGGRQSQQRWCELCHVPCTNEDAFRLHLQGKSHLALVRAIGEKKKII